MSEMYPLEVIGVRPDKSMAELVVMAHTRDIGGFRDRVMVGLPGEAPKQTEPIPRDMVYEAFDYERQFQDDKWGDISASGGHSLAEWVMLIEAEVQEAKEACIKGGVGRDSLRSELIQIGALVCAALEQHGTLGTSTKRHI